MDPVLSELCLKRFSSLDFFLGHANIDLVKVLPELSSMPSNAKLSLVAAIKDETLRQTGSRRGGVSQVPAFEIRRKGSETWKRYASAAKARDDHFGIFDAATLADLRPYDRSSCCNGLRTILNENKRDSEWFSREFDVRMVPVPQVVRNDLLFECTYGGTSQDCPFGPQGPDAFAPGGRGILRNFTSSMSARRLVDAVRRCTAMPAVARSRQRSRLDAMPRRGGAVGAVEKEREIESLRDS